MIIKWYCHSMFMTFPCPNTELINITYKTEWQLNSVNDSTWLWKSIWQSWTAFTANHSWSFMMLLHWTSLISAQVLSHPCAQCFLIAWRRRKETAVFVYGTCFWSLHTSKHLLRITHANTILGDLWEKKYEKCEIERNNLDTATENTETNTKHEVSLSKFLFPIILLSHWWCHPFI